MGKAQTPTLTSKQLAQTMKIADSDRLGRHLSTAKAMIEDYTRGCTQIPEEILNRACEALTREIYHQDDAPNGVKMFGGLDGAPIRLARDPFVAARPYLSRYRKLGFA